MCPSKYTEEGIEKALKAIDDGIPIREAARKFQIPRATLQFRRSDKFKKIGHGPAPVLTKDEEETLLEWIFECHRKGFPRRKSDVLYSVKYFLDKKPRPNPFVNNCPGNGWYKLFLKRHPEVTLRTAEFVTKASSNISQSNLEKWFWEIETYLRGKGYFEILEDPSRVFNGDETNFYLCPKNSKVLAPRGARNVYEVENTSSKMNLTVMFTFSATGVLVPPMVIYPYKRLPNYIIQSVPEGWGIGATETGWMRSETFYEYVSNVLYPFLIKSGTKFPVILFLDGHITHLTLQLSNLCRELEIILICLYPNATRILQPADVAAFQPIKAGWKRAVTEWKREHPSESLTKEKFAPILKKSIENSHNPVGIANGFRACGICPWDLKAIDLSKCIGKSKNIDEDCTEINNEITRNTLSYEKFVSIIGTEKLEIIRALKDENTKEDMLLYQILKEFDPVPELNQTELVEIMTNKEINLEEGIAKPQTEPESPKVSASCLNIGNTNFYVEDTIIEDVSFISRKEDECEIFNLDDIPIILPEEQLFADNDQTENQMEKKEIFLSKPTSVTNDSIDSLKDLLYWPLTPQRQGQKRTDHDPYVLTSTQWKQLKLEREESKRQKEIEKEIRKQKRTEKKFQTEVVKKKLKQGRQKKKRLISTSSLQTPSVNGYPECKDLLLETSALSAVSPSRALSEQMIKIDSVTRSLFSKSPNKIEILSDINLNMLSEITSEDIAQQLGLDLRKNLMSTRGMCFTCTYQFTQENNGLKCNSCRRSYHLKCVKKYDLHKSNSPIFECSTCLKKKY